MKLYEIPQELNNVLKIKDDKERALAIRELKMTAQSKTAGILAYIKNVNIDIEAIDQEIERLKKIKETRKNKVESMKGYLMMFMDYLGSRKFKSPLFSLAIVNKQPRLEVIDIKLIPRKFIKKEIILNVDKIAIKEAIKTGKKIKGVKLIDNETYLKINI